MSNTRDPVFDVRAHVPGLDGPRMISAPDADAAIDELRRRSPPHDNCLSLTPCTRITATRVPADVPKPGEAWVGRPPVADTVRIVSADESYVWLTTDGGDARAMDLPTFLDCFGPVPSAGERWVDTDGLVATYLRTEGDEAFFTPDGWPWQRTTLARFLRLFRRVPA